MKKILILPFFGKFNSYFKLFIDSCCENKDIDFLLVTDQDVSYLPQNIKVIRKSLLDLKIDFQSKFEFKITLDKPYKLCDYRPLYGYLFYEYIKEYDFWGYCDCDVIWGDLSRFFPDDLFLKYDKILTHGHLSFIRNKKEINENFLNFNTYKLILTSPSNYAYDESMYAYHNGFNAELIDKGFKVYHNDKVYADIDFRYFPFRMIYNPDEKVIFEYNNGKLYCLTKNKREEVAYIHLQKRNMFVDDVDLNHYLIVPNKFYLYKDSLLKDDMFWKDCFEDKINYFDFKKELRDERMRAIMRFLHDPHKIQNLIYHMRGKR